MAQKISSPQDSQKSYGELFNKKINDAAKIYLYNFLREPNFAEVHYFISFKKMGWGCIE